METHDTNFKEWIIVNINYFILLNNNINLKIVTVFIIIKI